MLDNYLHYNDPTLPNLSSLTFLFLSILLSSSLIAFDFVGLWKGRKKVRFAEMPEFTSIAMIGCGSMGGGMAQLFAEDGVQVCLSDPNEQMMDSVIEKAEKAGYHGKVKKFKDYEQLCNALSKPRLLVFSLPHGTVGDKVLEGLTPNLSKGDIVLDCGNENYLNTERRQLKSKDAGIGYIGCGVSGGYQAARSGPSMCPGGDESALKEVMPLLERVAAKDKEGKPCVGIIGKGGAGHYVKMVHNGIEHGMMSAICEAWGMMRKMNMGYEEIGNVFKKWNEKGELQGTFLVDIGADLSHKKESDAPHKNELVISEVLDKVVQDITGEEGTGIWSNTEAIELHVPSFTMTTAHLFRIASAYRGDRERVNKVTEGGFPPQNLNVANKDAFLEDLRKATYAGCLASFIQGMNVISRADRQHEWDINYGNVWQIWRAGCIIKADYISDEILKPILTSNPKPEDVALQFHQRVAKDIRNTWPSLKRVVAKAVETDQVAPSLLGTLEFYKIISGTDLPTSFYEAELDYFGSHMFDKKGEEKTGGPTEGKHHFEWKPARSQKEEYGRQWKL